MTDQPLPTSPERTAETAEFWDAANDRRLIVKRCPGTGQAFHPPRSISPFTGLAGTEWVEAKGTGTLYSFSVTRRHGTAHCLAYVQLAEGPIILSALVDCDFDKLAIGQAVCVTFKPSQDGQLVPMFVAETGA